MICKNLRWMAALTMAASLAITPSVTLAAPGANGGAKGNAAAAAAPTTTPIKHVVVIFQENVSFDHYFATYPNAENPEGELKFKAKNATQAVHGRSSVLGFEFEFAFGIFGVGVGCEIMIERDVFLEDDHHMLDWRSGGGRGSGSGVALGPIVSTRSGERDGWRNGQARGHGQSSHPA